MSGNEAALAARLRAELDELGRVVGRTEHLMAKAQQQNDPDYLDGVALNLHGFYSGVERIFEDIARVIDASVPAGPEWHRELLIQMSAEVASTRPAVLSRETRACLEAYRGFRHLVRNIYTFNLRPSRLQELATELRPCYITLVQEIMAFCSFLDKLGADDEPE